MVFHLLEEVILVKACEWLESLRRETVVPVCLRWVVSFSWATSLPSGIGIGRRPFIEPPLAWLVSGHVGRPHGAVMVVIGRVELDS